MLKPHWTHPSLFKRRVLLEKSHPTPAEKKLAHPAEHGPRFFADTADAKEIESLKSMGMIQGVTTNPTLLKKNGAGSWSSALQMMRNMCQAMAPFPVSLELTDLSSEESMIAQAKELADLGENTVIKVPVAGYKLLEKDSFTGIRVIKALWEKDIRTNATLVFNSNQAYLAASAGATYVSPFLGRLQDALYGRDFQGRMLKIEPDQYPATEFNTAYVATDFWDKQDVHYEWDHMPTDAGIRLINEMVTIFNHYRITTEILAASIRTTTQVTECMAAGADILTLPTGILHAMVDHPLSDQGLARFNHDAEDFTES